MCFETSQTGSQVHIDTAKCPSFDRDRGAGPPPSQVPAAHCGVRRAAERPGAAVGLRGALERPPPSPGGKETHAQKANRS